MRKYLFLVQFLFVSLFAVSCEQKEIRTLKKEFKNYVNKSFDDPSSFKEFVSILPYDTLSSVKTKDMLCNVIASGEDQKVFIKGAIEDNEKIMADIANKINPYRYSDYQRYKIQDIGNEVLLRMLDVIQDDRKLILNLADMKTFTDSIKYETPIYGYEIKYRCRTDEGIKMQSCYGYIDSLKMFKAIRPSKITSDEYSPQQKRAFELLKDNVKYLSTILDGIESVEEKIKELKLLI